VAREIIIIMVVAMITVITDPHHHNAIIMAVDPLNLISRPANQVLFF